MLGKVLCVVVFVNVCVTVSVGEYVTDEDYVDAVIDMLLNGVSKEFEMSSEIDNDSTRDQRAILYLAQRIGIAIQHGNAASLLGTFPAIDKDDDEFFDAYEEPILAGGIWKCGQCDDLKTSNLVYSEVNDVDNEMMTDDSLDIQIGLSLPNMKCVTVNSNVAGVVRRIAGACRGDTVTLSVAPAQHFTVQVYN